MRKIEYWAASLLIVALCVSNFYSYMRFQKNREVQSFLYELKKDSDIKIGQLGDLRESRRHEILLNGKKMQSDMKVLDLQEHTKLLSEIFPDNALVLRYSEMDCDVCIDSIVNKLNEYKDSIGLENIILLATTKNPNYLRRFRKINKIHFGVYKMSDNLDSALVDIGMPYMFVYNSKDGRINNTFVPQTENPQLTNEYLNALWLRYFAE